MATETLILNLNEATETLESPSAADKDLSAVTSVQPPPSTVDGAEVGGEASAEAPMEVLAGNGASGSDVEKKIRRAERFGVPVLLSEDEKRSSRAERFGSAPTSHGSDGSKKSEVSDASKKAEETKRKARAERFGLPVPSKFTDEDAKKKARLARFAPPSKVDSVEEDKRKSRALRFSEAPSSILPEANGKGNIEPKAAIVGKAIGGA